MRAEKTGARIECQPFHVKWQDHMSAHDFALLIAPVEHGKSFQVVGRILWEIGNDPDQRWAIISSTDDQAKKPLKLIKQYIESGDEFEGSKRLREVFPHLVPSDDPSDPWTDTQITIKRKDKSRDPTIQVCGAHGNIVGSRIDRMLFDDLLDSKNTVHEEQRKKMVSWVDSTCQTRIVQGGRIIFIGTPWHKEDTFAELAKRPGIKLLQFSAVLNPDAHPREWITLWPSQWPLERILARKGTMSDAEFQRTMLCRVRLDATSRFKEAWIITCARLGRGRNVMSVAPKTGGGRELPCFTGVDVAAGKKKENARTSICTAALLDNGRIQPLEIDVGLFTGPETVDKLKSVYQRYGSQIMVESNAVQIWLVQFAELQNIPVTAFFTGNNKWDPNFGVESLAVEMRQGEWVLPCREESDFTKIEGIRWSSDGLAALAMQALYFDPTQHTGDVLMSAWLCRESVRKYAGSERSKHVNMLAR